nr:MAG TPA: GDSL like Lipase Acylhydrolase [Caudoviricetes sp.]
MTKMKKRVLIDKNNNPIAPITLGESVMVNGSDLLTYLGGLNLGGGTSGSSDAHKLALAGNVEFIINFTNNTITHKPWSIYGDCIYFSTANFSQLSMELGNTDAGGNLGDLYYLVAQNTGMKLVKATNMTKDTGGLIICGLDSTTVYPMSYPLYNIKVIGGTVAGHPFKSISKIGLLGDSITYGGCMSKFLEHINGVRLGVNGATIRQGTNSIIAQAENITDDYDSVVIMGGTNDSPHISNNGEFVSSALGTIQNIGSTFDKNTFYGAYQYIIEKLLGTNPKIKILLVCPPRAYSSSTKEKELEKIGEAVINIANFYGLPYTDLWHRCPINSITNTTYLRDKLHPTDVGNNLIGNMVMGDFIKYYCGGIY